MRTTYKLTTTGGEFDFVGAASMAQAIRAGEQIFPGKTVSIEEASMEEMNDLFRAHSFDGIELDDE